MLTQSWYEALQLPPIQTTLSITAAAVEDRVKTVINLTNNRSDYERIYGAAMDHCSQLGLQYNEVGCSLRVEQEQFQQHCEAV